MALIKLNRTKTGAVPKTLADGELFIDQLNGKLYWADATGRVVTTNLKGEFPSGTVMIFRQSLAPTGWTKLTTNNDSLLRVVTGLAGDGGVTDFSALKSLATGSTVLTEDQIPSHTHPLTDPGHTHDVDQVYNRDKPWETFSYYTPAGARFSSVKTSSAKTGITIGGTGGGKGHTHTLSNIDLKYTDVIVARKD